MEAMYVGWHVVNKCSEIMYKSNNDFKIKENYESKHKHSLFI